MKSDTIGTLAKALSQAQADMKAAVLNAENPFLKNKYADLGAVIEAARPALAKHGLSFTQLVSSNQEYISLETYLLHESGEWLNSVFSLPFGDVKGRSLAQEAGSIITYMRRYSLAAILGVYAGDDDDGTDKGKVAEKKTQPAKPQPEPMMKPAMTLDEARKVTAKDGREYVTIPPDELHFHLKGISDALQRDDISTEKRAEFLKKQVAITMVLDSYVPEPPPAS